MEQTRCRDIQRAQPEEKRSTRKYKVESPVFKEDKCLKKGLFQIE
jgi:Pyruvate/2-oxoacid:ferredoxin oxidoreductase delta subunit